MLHSTSAFSTSHDNPNVSEAGIDYLWEMPARMNALFSSMPFLLVDSSSAAEAERVQGVKTNVIDLMTEMAEQIALAGEDR